MLQIYLFLTLIIVALIILSIDIKIYGLNKVSQKKCNRAANNNNNNYINKNVSLTTTHVYNSLNNGLKNIYNKYYNTNL